LIAVDLSRVSVCIPQNDFSSFTVVISIPGLESTTEQCQLKAEYIAYSKAGLGHQCNVYSIATCRARLKSEDVVQGKASLSDCKDLGATGRAKFASDNLSPVAVVK
jgi:hypothetical protein